MSAAVSRVLSILVALLLAAAVAIAWASDPDSGLLVEGVGVDDPFFSLVLGAYVLTTGVEIFLGAVMSVKVKGNPIGRILLALGTWQAATLFASAALAGLAPGGPNGDHLRNLGSWLGAWIYVPIITIPGVVILVLFPNGRALSRRWRVFADWASWELPLGLCRRLRDRCWGKVIFRTSTPTGEPNLGATPSAWR
jgi:hypothetical protein